MAIVETEQQQERAGDFLHAAQTRIAHLAENGESELADQLKTALYQSIGAAGATPSAEAVGNAVKMPRSLLHQYHVVLTRPEPVAMLNEQYPEQVRQALDRNPTQQPVSARTFRDLTRRRQYHEKFGRDPVRMYDRKRTRNGKMSPQYGPYLLTYAEIFALVGIDVKPEI